jgi:hypothetical protein
MNWPRVAFAVIAGNGLGLAAHLAAIRLVIPWLWSGAGDATSLAASMGLVAVSFMLVAAPPVLLGALGAWLARRGQVWVGLTCGLWSLTLVGAVPAYFPIAPGVWYAPTVLVLLSGALGGWMVDLSAQARSLR